MQREKETKKNRREGFLQKKWQKHTTRERIKTHRIRKKERETDKEIEEGQTVKRKKMKKKDTR